MLLTEAIKLFFIFNKALIYSSWAFSFFEIKTKLSPSIFHCLIVFELSPVSIIVLFNIQEALISPALGTSMLLTFLYWFIFIIDISFVPGTINKSLLIKTIGFLYPLFIPILDIEVMISFFIKS